MLSCSDILSRIDADARILVGNGDRASLLVVLGQRHFATLLCGFWDAMDLQGQLSNGALPTVKGLQLHGMPVCVVDRPEDVLGVRIVGEAAR